MKVYLALILTVVCSGELRAQGEPGPRGPVIELTKGPLVFEVGLGQLQPEESARPRPPNFGQRMTRFGGGIALGELARAELSGDEIGVDLAKSAPMTPEFLASLVLFDASMQVSDRVLRKALPGFGEGTSVKDKLKGALKHNVVLAGAMSLTQLVQVDFGGFEYGDALQGDFSKLEHAEVKLGRVDPQSLAITVGVFAAWGPAYSLGVKQGAKGLARKAGASSLGQLLKSFGSAVAKRFLASAAGKVALSLAPVPGSPLVALGWAALDVALAIADTAVLLQGAHAIEAPLQAANDRRLARGAVRAQAAEAEAAARAGTPEQLANALAETQAAFAGYRNLAYLGVAQADQQLFLWLRQRGYPQEELDALAERAYREFGRGLALPAVSALLDEALQQTLQQARDGELESLTISPRELERALSSHRRKVQALLADAEPELASSAHTQRLFLERLRASLSGDPARQRLVEAALAALETEVAVSEMLLETVRGPRRERPTPPPTGVGIDEVVGEVMGP